MSEPSKISGVVLGAMLSLGGGVKPAPGTELSPEAQQVVAQAAEVSSEHAMEPQVLARITGPGTYESARTAVTGDWDIIKPSGQAPQGPEIGDMAKTMREIVFGRLDINAGPEATFTTVASAYAAYVREHGAGLPRSKFHTTNFGQA